MDMQHGRRLMLACGSVGFLARELAAAMMPVASYHSLSGIGHMLHHFAPQDVVEAVRRIASKA